MKIIVRPAIVVASALLVLSAALPACSSFRDDGSSSAANLPQISADKLGQACSNFGTSPGDSAVFQDSDCPAGYCLVDATSGNLDDFALYCTADCDVYSCPTGYVCQANTLGNTKHACFKDPNAPEPPDAGTCQEPSGTYKVASTKRTDTTDGCLPLGDTEMNLDPPAQSQTTKCTRTWDADTCKFTLECDDLDTVLYPQDSTDVITVDPASTDLTAEITLKVIGDDNVQRTCHYEDTLSPE